MGGHAKWSDIKMRRLPPIDLLLMKPNEHPRVSREMAQSVYEHAKADLFAIPCVWALALGEDDDNSCHIRVYYDTGATRSQIPHSIDGVPILPFAFRSTAL